MIELLLLCAFLLVGMIVLKIILVVFKISFWALSLPLQILAATAALLIGLLLIVPAGVLLGLLALPFMLIIGLLPFILIGWGLYLLLRS
ncbi:MAG: hypothetical protein ONB44_19690 [candidate division KSB1 bacterium]|nr:hypothetical protein [candidate division KSB1 bacterium]MDZ7304352.1 hypothetical protein [candidate division KSB1 bacterium]MDZ7313665.1 hypothetical protein [candidate division KSB1 bacterium]